jgi:prepilin-type N-terminal cleavage/methylation domain-containing protein
MLNKLQQRKQDGFTIIEVMIVLAIAGLIMLIVFLAVPALNRSSHNTSIKNDVSGILGAVEEYANNNNGSVATSAHIDGSVVTIGGTADCSTSGANCATAKVSANTSDVSLKAVADADLSSDPTLGTIQIITGAVCDGNKPTSEGAVARSVVAYFMLEGGAVQCQQS